MTEIRMAPAGDSTGALFWYFAIGSMMNPQSMKNRSIVPLVSAPGELFDYELVFSGGMGFAEAVHCPGSSFHGVLHLLDAETMERLDKIEIAYKRVEGKARKYDGTTATVTVYTKSESALSGQENNPPYQRYLDVMIEGAKQFNVHQNQIEFLQNCSCRPRPLPHEFKSYEPALYAPLLSYEKDVKPYNGESTPTLRLAINQKVIEICADDVTNPMFKKSLHFYKQFGHRIELVLSRILYDPKYGCPEKIEDFTREHVAYIEHNARIVDFHHETFDLWKTIGRIEQRYRD